MSYHPAETGLVTRQRVGTLVGLLSVMLPLVAPGQSTPAGGPESAPAAPEALETVIVTSQKRAQRLQDVPLAVTALTAQSIQSAGVLDTQDLQEVVPGFVSNRKSTNAQPYIRGLGVSQATPGFDSSVSTYIDDVYMPSPIASSFDLNSIERIEVMKGPQGTLFGRNSSGGVVAVYTNDPAQSPQLNADLSYGSYQTITSRLYANERLADNLAMNLSVYTNNQDEGWGKNIVDDKDFFLGRSVDVRSKLLWNIDSHTDLLLAGWYANFSSNLGLFRLAPDAIGTGGYVCATCGFYDVPLSPNLPGNGGITQGTNWGASAKLTHEFSDVHLTNITAYQQAEPFFNIDSDVTPPNLNDTVQSSTEDTITNETDLTGSAGQVMWTAGFFYLHDRLNFHQLTTGSTVPKGSITQAFLTTDSYAPFAQATYEVLPDTNLTGGVRYTMDRRERSGHTGTLTTDTPAPTRDADFDSWSWRGALDHKFSHDVMAYISYSRGFKAGILNVQELNGPTVKPEINDDFEIGLKTQWLDNRLQLNLAAFHYSLQDLQLKAVSTASGASVSYVTNAASAREYGVDVDFDAVLTSTLKLRGGFEILDAQFGAFPDAALSTPNPATIGGNRTYFGSATDNRMPFAPDFSGNIGLEYSLPLASKGGLTLTANYAYLARFYFEPDPRFSQAGYGLLNASATWLLPDSKWSLSVWARNLSDRRYFSAAVVASGLASSVTPGEPRTVGVRVGIHL
jgi:iron complex outermembrane recepter protein